MTFTELVTQVSINVFPEGVAGGNIRTLYTNVLRDGLIDLQKKITCLQSENRYEYTQDCTFFFCGTTAFEAPCGFIQNLCVIPNTQDSMNPNQCDIVWAKPVTRQRMECLIEETAGGCVSAGCGCGIYMPYGYYYDYDQYYQYGELPYGLNYADATTDSTCRSFERYFAMWNGLIYLSPVINSNEKIIVESHGIKRHWGTYDVIPYLDESGSVDRQVVQALEYYVSADMALRVDCDTEKYRLMRNRYDQLVAELIYQCKEENRLPSRIDCFGCSC